MADELQGKEEGKAELLAATAITRARVAEDIAALAAKLFVAGAFDSGGAGARQRGERVCPKQLLSSLAVS